jgi:hypothetical protein
MRKQSMGFDLIGMTKARVIPWTMDTFVTFHFRRTALAWNKEIFIYCRSDDSLQKACVLIKSNPLTTRKLYSLISFQLVWEYAWHMDDTTESHDNERATRSFV